MRRGDGRAYARSMSRALRGRTLSRVAIGRGRSGIGSDAEQRATTTPMEPGGELAHNAHDCVTVAPWQDRSVPHREEIRDEDREANRDRDGERNEGKQERRTPRRQREPHDV